MVHALVKTKARQTERTNYQGSLARLSEAVSVQAAGRGSPTIKLSDGHELLTSFVGPGELRVALEQNQAEPLSLASADFDEDGVPDLVSGYAYNGQGIVTLLRGNIDSIHPNAPEAKQRKADGTLTPAPFLSPALAIEVGAAADFLGAGDFDADGHWDIVLASRGGTSLHFLAGDGRGNFGPEKEITLNGVATAFATGEINRRDGLTDIVVGTDGPDGPVVSVFEGPLGGMRSSPEVLNLPAPAVAFALGEIDGDYPMDLVIAAGNHLIISHGRDRKLSLSEREQTTVAPPHLTERVFDFDLRSVAIGDFSGDGFKDLALLSNDGAVHILTQPEVTATEWEVIKREVENYTAGRTSRFRSTREDGDAPLRILPAFQFDAWQLQSASEQRWPGAESMIKTRVSSVAADTPVLLDRGTNQLHIISKDREGVGERQARRTAKAQSRFSQGSWQNTSLDSSTASFPGGFGFTLPERKLRMPSAQHYSIAWEQELNRNTVMSVAYVGTQGRHLLRLTTPNLGPNAFLIPTVINVVSFQPNVVGVALGPGQLPTANGTSGGRPVDRAGSVAIYESSANSRYDSLQVQLRGRFRRATQYQFSYTLSKATDDVSDIFDLAGAPALPQNSFNLAGERGPANFDVRHRFTYSFVASLPALKNHATMLRALFGKFQVAGSGAFRTGQPFTVNSIFDVNLDGNLTDRLDNTNGLIVTGDRRQPLRLTAPDLTTLLAPIGQSGRIGRNTFRAGNVIELDLSVTKNFLWSGARSLVLRADIFNFINRANFGVPVRWLGAADFGQATDTITPGGRVQLEVKYSF